MTNRNYNFDIRPGAWVKKPAWIAFHPKLSDGAKNTWEFLALRMTYKTRQLVMRQESIGTALGLGRNTVNTHIKQLSTVGAIRVTPRFNEARERLANLYDIADLDPLTDRDPDTDPITEKRAEVSAENRTNPGAKNRAAGSRSSFLSSKPQTPDATHTPGTTPTATSSDGEAAAPQTPRSARPRKGSRSDGSNPRAIATQAKTAAAHDVQARNWLHRMAPLFENDPEGFFEILNAGVAQDEWTRQQHEQILDLAATHFGFEDTATSHATQQPTNAQALSAECLTSAHPEQRGQQ